MLDTWTVQMPGTGELVHANTPSWLKVVTRREGAAWLAMTETISANKATIIPRLPRSIARGGFLSDICHRVTIPFFD